MIENGEKGQQSETKNADYSVFRDSPLRYLGYANEVGESFRFQFPRFVKPSYAVSFGYCFMDSVYNGYRTWTTFDNTPTKLGARSKEFQTIVAMGDTLLWQTLASVLIPGAAINLIVKATRMAVSRSPLVIPSLVVTWLPTSVGLSSIPFIIQPIDHGVDYFLDSSIRAWMTEDTNRDKDVDTKS